MSNVYVCMLRKKQERKTRRTKNGPRSNLRASNCKLHASGAIFGKKQSRSSYYIFHPTLGSPSYMHFAKVSLDRLITPQVERKK